jgi:predicted ribosome quality control (RQC) complex YloA/Tae2 family protein
MENNRPEKLTYKIEEIEKLLSLLDSMQFQGLKQAQTVMQMVQILQNPCESAEASTEK